MLDVKTGVAGAALFLSAIASPAHDNLAALEMPKKPENISLNQPEPLSAVKVERILKLHLSRPDLIPFPVFFEVYA